ncbi:MAG: cytochrome c [Acidobacteria bacterium]|nr:cytochrome c [Acidobacteriota bacterium]
MRLLILLVTVFLVAFSQGRPQRAPGAGVGPDDKHIPDPTGAERGKKLYAAECINCHGTQARGTERGADLIRSTVVLKDRSGIQIGDFLNNNQHKLQVTPAGQLTREQHLDLAHFLHGLVLSTLRRTQDVLDVLTGEAKAGAAYFNSEGKCAGCHSGTGDLKGIGRRYEPVQLQQRFLFPRGSAFGRRFGGGPQGKPVTLEVTPAGGKTAKGTLVFLDDFNVALRDDQGEYQSWKRTPGLKVVKNDPLQLHAEMLDKYTDKNIHDITAYLESFK